MLWCHCQRARVISDLSLHAVQRHRKWKVQFVRRTLVCVLISGEKYPCWFDVNWKLKNSYAVRSQLPKYTIYVDGIGHSQECMRYSAKDILWLLFGGFNMSSSYP